MKILLITALFISQSALSLDMYSGYRESFVTSAYAPYGSDSAARLRRSIKDQGFDNFTLNTKLSLNPRHNSYIFTPKPSSDLQDYETMISLVKMGLGKVIIKPQVIETEDFITIIPYQIKKPSNPKLLIQTYQRELNRFLKLSKDISYETLVISSGMIKIYEEIKNTKSLINFHNYIKRGLAYKTKLAIHLGSLPNLKKISQNRELIKNINTKASSIFYSLNLMNLPDLLIDGENFKLQLEELIKLHYSLFPKKEMALSDIMLPTCKTPIYTDLDLICSTSSDDTIPVRALVKLSKILNQLNKKNLINSIEFVTSTTDYEPDNVDSRLIYYRDFFKSLNMKALIKEEVTPLRVDPPIPAPVATNKKKACIYYDAEDGEKKDLLGRVHSRVLESLLGGFPNYKVQRKKIREYKESEIIDCDKVFYIASHFASKIPDSFIRDIKSSIATKDIFWFNYKISKLIADDDLFEFKVDKIIGPDKVPTKKNPNIGFYQFFEYKGEEFFKKSAWNPLTDNFISSPEIAHIELKKPHNNIDILSKARHNKTNKKLPYAIHQKIGTGGLWYIADLPFSFIHYEDRYLILTDILWDFLGEKLKDTSLKALVRFEDINPSLNLPDLNWAMTYLNTQKVPFSLALIPYYVDMLGQTPISNFKPTYKPITKYPNFMGSISLAKRLGADFIMHGVAHQADDYISGYTGQSGADYEFWLYPENKPIPYDSVDWVMNRLEMGEEVFRDINIKASAWEIPHYAASVLDYYIFGKVFEWGYHRSVLFSHEAIQDTDLEKNQKMFECLEAQCREKRRALLRNIKVEADYDTFGASLYPYPIYKDSYGQKIMPETLGMVDFAAYSPSTWRPVSSPNDIIRRAKKLKVIRGAYASFFWHTTLLNPKNRYYQEVPGSYEKIGGKKTLIKIVTELKKMGYKFVSISDCKYFPQKGCK